MVEKIDPITIRPVLAGEIPQLSVLANRAYLDHYHWLWTDEGAWYAEQSFSKKALEREYGDPSNFFFFAFWKGEPAGFLKLRDEPAEFPDNSLYLERIYLVKWAVGKGLGTRLMELARVFAAERGRGSLVLKAMECSTASISFYHKSGFEICGEDWLDYTLLKDGYRGMVKMKKDLNESAT